MNKYKFLVIVLVICAKPCTSSGESSTCLTAYREGAAPALFHSPKCPRWDLSNYAFRSRSQSSPARCQEDIPSHFTGDDNISERIDLEYAHPVVAKFDRSLVEGKHNSFGCYYLSENLNENGDYPFRVQKNNQENTYNLPEALPDDFDHHCGGSLNLYNDKNMCLHFGMTDDGDKDQCLNHEGFSRLLRLLESVPALNTSSTHESSEHTSPDSRYILKKRFDRGSYGEVWLAFHWNCSKGNNASTWTPKDKDFTFNSTHPGIYDENSVANSSAYDSNDSAPVDHMIILKRIMVERGPAVYLSGLREKYFGEVFLNASTFLRDSLSAGISDSCWREPQSNSYDLLRTHNSAAQEIENTRGFENIFPRKNRLLSGVYEEGLNHIARYVESFESQSNEIWLVFRHEGVSLSKVLYTAEVVNSADEVRHEHVKRAQALHPSKWWHWLKTTKAGQEGMKNLIRQLLMALKACHDRNITHRDIKPENMVICFEDHNSGRCMKGSPSGEKNYTTKMRIIDFGSAMDEFTVKHLYGFVGPSRAEQTYEYTPPEALLNATWYQGATSTTLKYDMWSIGVVILELILGSPDVFQINAKTQALLDQHIEGWNEDLKKLAYKLRAFMEMCILIPGSSSKVYRTWGTNDQGAVSPASWKCSEEFFSCLVKSRDPLKLGFPNVWAMRLVRQLLVWNPEDRLSVDDALRHPYFSSSSQR